MSCCNDKKIIKICGKCNDLCSIIYPDGTTHNDYVPYGLNIGGDDYLDFDFCMNCGQMVGNFPVEIPKGD